jgi:hypothetical protein
MQRTPAQSAERRDPSAEQRSQSEERSKQDSDAELIRQRFFRDIEQHGPPYESYTLSDLEKRDNARCRTYRSRSHLRSQTKALREAVTRAKESSIKRQVKFLYSAFKEYRDTCERVLDEEHLTCGEWNYNTTLLDWVMKEGQKDYEEAMSWADDFFERQEKEKAAQQAEALKAAKAHKS